MADPARSDAASDEAFQRFLRRVWRTDIRPLLNDRLAGQRRAAARAGSSAAGSAGLLVDRLLGLKGRPFARAMTVLGGSLGAMLPDVWDWRWLRETADESQRAAAHEGIRRCAADLEEDEALALFGLDGRAARDELRSAWRQASKRWHPDLASDEQRREHHLRFISYQCAYERLERAFDEGRLPRQEC